MLFFPRWQIWGIIVLCLITPLFILPNFQSLSGYLPIKNKINLGLDLQGGVHLAYQAKTDDYLTSKVSVLKNEIRKILRPSDKPGSVLIGYRDFIVQKNGLSFSIVKPQDLPIVLDRLNKIIDSVDGAYQKNYDITHTNNVIEVKMTEPYKDHLQNTVIKQAIEVMRRRIDAFGTREPNILRQGADKIVLQVPGESRVDKIKSEIGKTAQLSFHMVVDNPDSLSPLTQVLTLPSSEFSDQKITLEADPLITGDSLVNASLTRDENGQPAVSFTFDSQASYIFSKVTSENIGRLFAIVLDKKVISAPRIQSAILGGNGIITGNFSTEEASTLSMLLRSGALPAELTVVEERTIGPELGVESIQAGTKSLVYGFIAVSIFMILFYGLSGVFSVIALTVNVVMVFALLSLLSATLTLPGIAGIVLGVGVAVDANVLINERIREELRRGHSVFKSVSIGYEKAWATILDSHVTGVLSSLVMFFLGSGPIRGFAVTLAIGVILSLFTAVWISRLLFSVYLNHKKPQHLKFGLSGV